MAVTLARVNQKAKKPSFFQKTRF